MQIFPIIYFIDYARENFVVKTAGFSTQDTLVAYHTDFLTIQPHEYCTILKSNQRGLLTNTRQIESPCIVY